MKGAWLVAACALALAACAGSDPFRDAQNAYARGDLAAASESLRIAADAGDAKAARALGSMFETGMEVGGGQKIASRPEEAARWYRRAADLGDAQAAHRLALMYTYGRGVPVDYAEARRLFGDWPVPYDGSLDKYGVQDRDEIEAWMRSARLAMDDQIAVLRRGFEAGVSLTVIFSARNGPSLKGNDIPLKVADSVAEAARKALAIAPPTEAAKRHNIAMSVGIDFRYKD
jgi:hypothetical protein